MAESLEDLTTRVDRLERILGLQKLRARAREGIQAGGSDVSDHCGNSNVSNHCTALEEFQGQ